MKGLVKVAPIVVILACVASLVFALRISKNKTASQEEQAKLTADLTASKKRVTEAQEKASGLQTKLSATENEVDKAKANLAAANVQLDKKTREADDLTASKKDLEGQVADNKAKLAKAEDEMKPLQDKLKELQALDVEKLGKQVDTLTKENELLSNKVKSSDAEVAKLQDELESKKSTPAGTRGHVALSKDQWNFVVLDIGKNNKVTEHASFLLYRDSKLIAKARVTAVNATNSVAELVPGFTVGAPQAGDLAVAIKEM